MAKPDEWLFHVIAKRSGDFRKLCGQFAVDPSETKNQLAEFRGTFRKLLGHLHCPERDNGDEATAQKIAEELYPQFRTHIGYAPSEDEVQNFLMPFARMHAIARRTLDHIMQNGGAAEPQGLRAAKEVTDQTGSGSEPANNGELPDFTEVHDNNATPKKSQ